MVYIYRHITILHVYTVTVTPFWYISRVTHTVNWFVRHTYQYYGQMLIFKAFFYDVLIICSFVNKKTIYYVIRFEVKGIFKAAATLFQFLFVCTGF